MHQSNELRCFALLLAVAAIAAACSDSTNGGQDLDAGSDGGEETDAGADAPQEGGPDGAIDSASEAATDAAADVGDAQAADAKSDAGDASVDAAASACPAGAHSMGPLQPTAATDLAGVGTLTWAGPSNARVSDDFGASVTGMVNNQVTHYLVVSSFGFNVPVQATITGVVVDIERKATNAIADNEVRLLSGAIGGDNKATPSVWPASDAIASYGASNDKWGLIIAPSDVNATSFGAALSAKYTSVSGNGSPSVDQVRMTVHYTCP